MQSLQNEIDSYFNKFNRPFVIASWGMSLDGKTVTHQQDNRQISALESQSHCHQLREQVDAILIGSNTAVQDDPLLTARNTDNKGKHPIRIVVSSTGRLPASLKIFDQQMPAKTWVVTASNTSVLFDEHIEVLLIKKNKQGQVDLLSLLYELGKRGIRSLLVEGGMTLLESFFDEHLINKVNVYLSPVIIGKLQKKHALKNTSFSVLGNDCLLNADYY